MKNCTNFQSCIGAVFVESMTTDLHCLCKIPEGEDDSKWRNVIKFLDKLETEEERKKAVDDMIHNRTTPLNVACERRPPVHVVAMLIDASPDMVVKPGNVSPSIIRTSWRIIYKKPGFCTLNDVFISLFGKCIRSLVSSLRLQFLILTAWEYSSSHGNLSHSIRRSPAFINW